MAKRNKAVKSWLVPVGAACAASMAAAGARAGTLYWDPNGQTSGTTANGTWDLTSLNWSTTSAGGSPTNYSGGSDVIFSAGSPAPTTAAVNLSSSMVANSLTINSGSTTISSLTGTSATVSLNVANGITVNSGATFSTDNVASNATGSITLLATASQTWTNNGTASMLIASGALGSSSTVLTLAGTGPIQLGNTSQNNTFNLDGGTLIVNGPTVTAYVTGFINIGTVVFESGTFYNDKGSGSPAFSLAGPTFTIYNYKGATPYNNITLGSAAVAGSSSLGNYALNFTGTNSATNLGGSLVGTMAGQTLSLYAEGTTVTGGNNGYAAVGVGFNSGAYNPYVIVTASNATEVVDLNSGNMSGGLTLGSSTLSGGLDVINAASVNTASGVLTSGPGGIGTLNLSGGTLAAGVNGNNIKTNINIIASETFGSTSTVGSGSAATSLAYPVVIDGSNLSSPSTVNLTTTPVLTVVEPTTINDVITGTGFGLTKAGASKLTLGGSNTYTGNTTISAGTVTANGVQSTGTGNVTVNTGGVLAGTGNAGFGSTGVVTISGGNISGGSGATTADSVGNLSTGSQTWTSGAYVSKFTATNSANDVLILSGFTATPTAGFVVDLQGTAVTSLAAGTYVLAVDTGATGGSDPFGTTASATNLTLEVNGSTLAVPAGYSLSDAVSESTGLGGVDLDLVVATPEPTSLVLLAAVAGPLALGRRRQRRAAH
jgi:fibronectin-binding autotransporter adhesin